MRLWPIFALCLLCGCAKKPARVSIPARCIQIKVTDFTQPCETLANGDLMCNRVRVHAKCVGVK